MHQEAKFSLHIITLNGDPGTTRRARTWWNFHNSSLWTLFAICLCVSGENKNETTNPKSAQNSEALGEGSFCDAPPRTTESKKHPFYFYPETSWLKCASANSRLKREILWRQKRKNSFPFIEWQDIFLQTLSFSWFCCTLFLEISTKIGEVFNNNIFYLNEINFSSKFFVVELELYGKIVSFWILCK